MSGFSPYRTDARRLRGYEKRAVSGLIQMLRDTNGDIRSEGIEGLVEWGRAAEALMIRALGDPDPLIRSGVVEVLGRIRSEKAIDALIIATGDGAEPVRSAAITALATIGPPASDKLDRAAHKDYNWMVQEGSVKALGMIRNSPVNGRIIALADSQPKVRLAAVHSLGATENDRAIRGLIRALRDDERTIQTAAKDVLLAWRPMPVLHPLVSAMRIKKYDKDRRRKLSEVIEHYSKTSVDENNGVEWAAGIFRLLWGKPSREADAELSRTIKSGTDPDKVALALETVRLKARMRSAKRETVLTDLGDKVILTNTYAAEILLQLLARMEKEPTCEQTGLELAQTTKYLIPELIAALDDIILQEEYVDGGYRSRFHYLDYVDFECRRLRYGEVVMRGLSELGRHSVAPLIATLSGDNRDIQGDVVTVLARIGQPAVGQMLAFSLVRPPEEPAVPVETPTLDSYLQPWVAPMEAYRWPLTPLMERQRRSEALSESARKAYEKAVAEWKQKHDAGLQVIRRIRDPKAVPELIGALKASKFEHEQKDLREAIYESLAGMEPADLVPLARELGAMAGANERDQVVEVFVKSSSPKGRDKNAIPIALATALISNRDHYAIGTIVCTIARFEELGILAPAREELELARLEPPPLVTTIALPALPPELKKQAMSPEFADAYNNENIAPALVIALGDDDVKVRRFVTAWLGNLGQPAVAALLGFYSYKSMNQKLDLGETRLKHEERQKRHRGACLEALCEIDDPRAVPELGMALKANQEDPELCDALSRALAHKGRLAFPYLVEELTVTDNVRRGRAVNVAVGIGALDPLIGMVSHENQNVRLDGVKALGKIQDERALLTLIIALRDPDTKVTKEAISSLSKLHEISIPYLISMLGEDDQDRRTHAIEALSNIREPAVNPLIEATSNENQQVSLGATEALGLVGQPAVSALISVVMSHVTEYEAWDAPPGTRPGLNAVVIHSDEPPAHEDESDIGLSSIEVQTVPAPMSGRSNSGAGGDELFAAYDDEVSRQFEREQDLRKSKSAIRHTSALEALRSMRDVNAIPDLVSMAFGHGIQRIRDAAVGAVLEMGTPQTAKSSEGRSEGGTGHSRLSKLLVQRFATPHVETGKPEKVPVLLAAHLAKETRTGVIEDVLFAIDKLCMCAAITDATTIPALVIALGSENPKTRQIAVAALDKLGEPIIEPLIEGLGSENEHTCQGAIDLLIKRGDPAVERLISVLHGKNANAGGIEITGGAERRAGAIRVLGGIKTQKAMIALTGALGSQNQLVREGASEALRMTGGAVGTISAKILNIPNPIAGDGIASEPKPGVFPLRPGTMRLPEGKVDAMSEANETRRPVTPTRKP